EVHVVQKGDTLWDICAYYFNDPWRWPEVWGKNPQITNPHWIYPGNLVRLVGTGPLAAPATEPTGETPEAPPPAPVPAAPATADLRQIAFVGLAELKVAGTVSGATDEVTMLSRGDDIFIDYPEGKPPQLGVRYSIYTPDRDVKEPGTGDVIGEYVVI